MFIRLGNKSSVATHSESGFTLLEVVVTTMLMSVVFLVISESMAGLQAMNRQARNYLNAVEYAQHRLEYYRNAGYNSIPDSEDFTSSLPGELTTPRSGTMVFSDLNPVIAGLKKLDITISYKDGSVRTVMVSTLVAQRGIDRWNVWINSDLHWLKC